MNIILLSIDCLRYDRCGFNGYYRRTTPVLTSLAEESLIYDNAYATGPYTTESVPGIIAGEHSYNGSYFGEDPAWKAISPQSATIAERLASDGYETIATLTNPHLTRARNFDSGFTDFHNLRTKGSDRAEDEAETTVNPIIAKLRTRFRQSERRIGLSLFAYLAHRYRQYRNGWPTIEGQEVTNKLKIQLQNANQPFFLWTHFMDIHAPIHPKVAERSGLPAAESGIFRRLYNAANHARGRYDPLYDRLYDSAVRYVDGQISQIVATLKSKKKWENTVLIITGDHGEVLYDRNEIYGHPRHHHYDESLRVPLLVRIPGISGRRIDRPMSLAWLPKLLMNLLNISSENFPGPSGGSFHSPNDSQSLVVSDSLDKHGHTISIRGEEHKLISHFADDNTLERRYPYFEDDEVFAYRLDRTERTPIDRNPAILSGDVDKLKRTKDDLRNLQGRFSEQMEERLADLGYRVS